MDIKIIKIQDNQYLFEEKIKEMMEKGYKINNTCIVPNTIGLKMSINLMEQKITYFAIMIKE